MNERAMVFPRKDGGHQRVVRRDVKVDFSEGRPTAHRTTIRIFTGPRKALRCR